jgi:APA family basic amino acid/polyamine antiporter
MSDLQPKVEARRESNAGLLRTLGFFSTTMFVVGAVIGSGIFRKPGVMAGTLGSPELLLSVWVIAGLVTLIGALVNAEIAAMIPEAGGQYVFFHRMYGPLFAYVFGWAMFAVIKTGAIASLSYVFADGVAQFVPLPELSSNAATFSIHLPFIGDIRPLADIGAKCVAASLVVVLTIVNYLGVRLGSAVQNIFTVAKLVALVGIVSVALLMPEVGRVENLTTASVTIRPVGLALIAAFAAALSGAFWAYDGWNDVSFIAGEVKNPQRNLPRGLILGMGIVIAVYLFVNLAYTYVLPVDVMAKSKLVAADVAERCFAGGGRWIAIAIMISTFGAANSNILAAARIYFSMARRKVFPLVMGAVHPQFHTPSVSLLVQALWSILLLFSGTFDSITDTLVFVAWIFYAAGAYGIFILRRKEPSTPRPYRVPGYPILPWIFIGFAVIFLGLTIYNDIMNYRSAVAAGRPGIINSAFGTFLVFLGLPIYFFYKRRLANS